MPPISGSSTPHASPKGSDMTDTDRTEYPLASHGTLVPEALAFDATGDESFPVVGEEEYPDWDLAPGKLGWQTEDLNEPKEEFKKAFPFMFDLGILPVWDEEVNRAQQALRSWGIDVVIDEVAVIVPDANMAAVYVFDAVKVDGVEHFNADEDSVAVQPFQSEYRVRYDFLRIEGKPYRVEVMHMTDGISPLHASMYLESAQSNAPVTIHLSFKCADEAEYHAMCDRLERVARMHEAQSCESSYGLFSYWRTDFTDLYIKPRVNKRDAK